MRGRRAAGGNRLNGLAVRLFGGSVTLLGLMAVVMSHCTSCMMMAKTVEVLHWRKETTRDEGYAESETSEQSGGFHVCFFFFSLFSVKVKSVEGLFKG